MRVIGGDWKGRKIQAPPGKHTRPLMDRIKQSMFDWLGQRCDDWSVIDICAGSGGFGIEAASRGARQVALIDNDPQAQQTIMNNLKHLGMPQKVQLHRGMFQQVLPRLQPADLVFADPPFPWFQEQPELLQELLEAVRPVCDGQFIIRGEKGQDLPAITNGWTSDERRTYGRSWVQRLLPT